MLELAPEIAKVIELSNASALKHFLQYTKMIKAQLFRLMSSQEGL